MLLVGAIIHAAFRCIDIDMLFKHLPAFCSFRYEDAVSKYEAVMKTEPNVMHFRVLAKERICHALAQVRTGDKQYKETSWTFKRCLKSGLGTDALK